MRAGTYGMRGPKRAGCDKNVGGPWPSCDASGDYVSTANLAGFLPSAANLRYAFIELYEAVHASLGREEKQNEFLVPRRHWDRVDLFSPKKKQDEEQASSLARAGWGRRG